MTLGDHSIDTVPALSWVDASRPLGSLKLLGTKTLEKRSQYKGAV